MVQNRWSAQHSFHMLWTQEVSKNLSKILSSQSILNPRVAA